MIQSGRYLCISSCPDRHPESICTFMHFSRLVPSITSVYTKDSFKEAIPDLWINYSLNNHIVLIELQKNILFGLYKSPLA